MFGLKIFTRNPDHTMKQSNEKHLQIIDGSGQMMVKIKHDGTLEYGEHYNPDAAARAFWGAILAARPEQLR